MGLEHLRKYELSRVKKRKHHPCRRHGNTRVVCEDCMKVYCPKCPPHDCIRDGKRVRIGKRRKEDNRMDNPVCDPSVKKVWEFMRTIEGAMYIEPLVADYIKRPGYWACFKPGTGGHATAGNFHSWLYGLPEWKALTDRHPNLTDSGTKPQRWKIGFHVK